MNLTPIYLLWPIQLYFLMSIIFIHGYALATLLTTVNYQPPSLTWRERMKAQRHIRPHVNPLQRRFVQQPFDASAVSFDESRPLHLDIGCGKGHFCADLAELRPDLNVLGIEIREPLVEEAQRLSDLAQSHNLRFLAGSANTLLAPCVDALLAAKVAPLLASCSIQFPDPVSTTPKLCSHRILLNMLRSHASLI